MERFVRTPHTFLAVLLILSVLSATSGALVAHLKQEFTAQEPVAHVTVVGVSTTLAFGPAGYAVGLFADEFGVGNRFIVSPDGITFTKDEPGISHSVVANVFQSVYGDWFE